MRGHLAANDEIATSPRLVGASRNDRLGTGRLAMTSGGSGVAEFGGEFGAGEAEGADAHPPPPDPDVACFDVALADPRRPPAPFRPQGRPGSR